MNLSGHLIEKVPQQQRILILAANPKNTNGLRLDEELREIEQGLQRAKHREQFEIKLVLAVRPRDIHRSILDFNPSIIHFSGHGAGEEGLVFEDDTGNEQFVSGTALADLFKLFADQVNLNCVVLNGCYSQMQAQAISEYVNYVVGMNQAIGDQAALKFAVGFYDALGAGKSIDFAYQLGRVAIEVEGIQEHLVPVLLKKLKIDSICEVNNEEKTFSSKEVATLIRPKGRYVSIEETAKGSIATIYKARDQTLERYVAIKVLNRLDLKQEFKESVKAAAEISDEEHFITIYDSQFDEKNNFYCYIMQWIEGENLRQWIDDYGKDIPLKDAHKIIVDIGGALVRSWKLGFTNGNIKPPNVMLNNDLEPFISSFNLRANLSPTRMLQELKSMKKLGEKEYREALAYLLPERFNKLNPQTQRTEKSDQYLLGILAYELLTGDIPKTLDSLEDLRQKGHKAFKKLTSIINKRSDCLEVFDRIILKMTSLDPEDRYTTLQKVMDEFLNHKNIFLNITKESYLRCARQPNFDDDFFKMFYTKFIEKGCPEAKIKFPSMWKDEDWKRQHQLLKEAVLLLFTYFEHQEPEELNILSRIAEIHSRKRKDISVDFYTPFIDALISTVTEFDPACEDEAHKDIVKESWQKVTEPGIKYMQSKY